MRKILILLFLLTAGFIHSQTPGDIITDRPDQTESTDILQPGYVQIETGVMHERIPDDGIGFYLSEESSIYISTLIRIGVFENLELRIAPEYGIINNRSRYELDPEWYEQKSEGFTPLVLGTKIKIVAERLHSPALSFLFNIDLPEIAGKDFKSSYTTPEVRLAIAKELSDRFGLGVNVGAEFNMALGETNGLYTVALGLGLLDNLSGFIEFYGFFRQYSKNTHFLDGGLTYLIQKNIQLDLSAGTGLTDFTQDYFISGGLSVRLPR